MPPIGVSLWAKIKPPQPIIELHGKENPPLASLKLSVSYSHSMYTVTLEMPETMNVSVSPLFAHFF